MTRIDEIEKLRCQLDEMIETGRFSFGQILIVSQKLDTLIDIYDSLAKEAV